MRILVLSPRCIWPETRGDQLTISRLVQWLHAEGHEVVLCALVRSEDEHQVMADRYSKFCLRVETVFQPRSVQIAGILKAGLTLKPLQVGYFASKDMQKRVDGLIEEYQPDLLYAHMIRTSEYIWNKDFPRVLHMTLSQDLNTRRAAMVETNPIKKLVFYWEAARSRKYERATCKVFDKVMLTGQKDIDILADFASPTVLVRTPHGQDYPEQAWIDEQVRDPKAIVMSGVMEYYSNTDAVLWFADKIFPKIQKEIPDAKFWVVGRDPTPALQALDAKDGITVTGTVPSVHDWVGRATVAAVPVRIAGGMQNKTLIAMGCQTPVVCTSPANEGIMARHGKHCIVKDDPQAFADAVVELIRDKEKNERMAKAGREFVLENWTWEGLFRKEFEHFEDAVARRENSGPAA